MALPNAEPVFLIIDIVMKVVMRHNPHHLMPEQLFNYVRRAT